MPITRSEELKLIRRAKRGDSEAAGKLITAHEGMLRRWVGHDEDVLQIARMEMLRTIKRFNPKLGHRFTTFCSRSIILRGKRAKKSENLIYVPKLSSDGQKKHFSELGAINSMSTKNGGDIPIKSAGLTPAEVSENSEQIELLKIAISELPPVERDVIRSRMRGIKFREMAERMGVSKQRVQQIESAARQRIKRALSPSLAA